MCNVQEGTNIVIDRIENGIVVVEFEDASTKEMKQEELPEGIQEGYVLQWKEGKWVLDMEAYERRKAEIEKLLENFFD